MTLSSEYSGPAKLAATRLMLRDARPAGAFLDALPTLAELRVPYRIICDWVPEGAELAAARQTSRETGIQFLFPG
jgi:hypothetical protein